MKSFILGLSGLLAFASPLSANWSKETAVYVHNSCHEEVYIEVTWYDYEYEEEYYKDGWLPPFDHASQPDFYISNTDGFYYRAKSDNFTWAEDFVPAGGYERYDFTLYCYNGEA